MRHHGLLNTTILVLWWAGPAMAAEITAQRESPCELTLSVKGPIAQGDGERVALELQNTTVLCKSEHVAPVTVFLDSPGCSVQEALIMGRAMRKHHVFAAVSMEATCASSCVLAFVGGADRSYLARLGVHRPYFEDARGLSAGDIEQSWRHMDAEIRRYLQEMNISQALADIMMATPPEMVRWLSDDEQQQLRIAGADAIEEEIEIAKKAAYYRMSSAEYRQGWQRVLARCRPEHSPEYLDCIDSAVLGIPLPEIKARKARAKAVCSRVAHRSTTFDDGNPTWEAKAKEVRDACGQEIVVGGKTPYASAATCDETAGPWDYFACIDAAVLGISLPEAQSRMKRAKATCMSAMPAPGALEDTPAGEARWKKAFMPAFNACMQRALIDGQ